MQANAGFSKFADAYLNNPEIRKQIDGFKESGLDLVEKLHDAIDLKSKNLDSGINEYYPIEEFLNMDGSLTIIGLSPYNDSHIFNSINKNRWLSHLTYYYFDENEKSAVNELLAEKKIEYKSVREFWVRKNT